MQQIPYLISNLFPLGIQSFTQGRRKMGGRMKCIPQAATTELLGWVTREVAKTSLFTAADEAGCSDGDGGGGGGGGGGAGMGGSE